MDNLNETIEKMLKEENPGGETVGRILLQRLVNEYYNFQFYELIEKGEKEKKEIPNTSNLNLLVSKLDHKEAITYLMYDQVYHYLFEKYKDVLHEVTKAENAVKTIQSHIDKLNMAEEANAQLIWLSPESHHTKKPNYNIYTPPAIKMNLAEFFLRDEKILNEIRDSIETFENRLCDIYKYDVLLNIIGEITKTEGIEVFIEESLEQTRLLLEILKNLVNISINRNDKEKEKQINDELKEVFYINSNKFSLTSHSIKEAKKMVTLDIADKYILEQEVMDTLETRE